MQVTGAGNGIGREIAMRLAREGCSLAVADIDADAAHRTVADLRKLKVIAVAFQVDVSNFEQVLKLKRDIITKMGGTVDILVNNAGLMPKLSLFEGNDSDIDRIVRVNVVSHVFVSALG